MADGNDQPQKSAESSMLDLLDPTERWVPEPRKHSNRTAFERDRDRVLHSSALRRLGAKTQVLGPESDDFIRTRLTHSLEVAQIGRSLAYNLGADPYVVETACLSHDLGHPPYGHNGERALAEVASSIGGFEGNAQTFRILTRLEPKVVGEHGRHAGLNLTRATLDAVIKYPWGRGEGPLRGDGSPTTKFNVYRDDLLVYEWVRGARGYQKSVEAQLMDLADDIAYSTHDVEDGLVRGLIDVKSLCEPSQQRRVIEETSSWYRFSNVDALGDAFERLLAQEDWPEEFTGKYVELAKIKDLTSDLIGRFISSVCQANLKRPLSRYNAHVVVPEETLAEITLLKGLAVTYVMLPRESEPLYHEQRTILFDLVDALVERPESLEPHFYELWKENDEDGRLRVIIDQVASLTDQSARQWHSRLCGFLRN